MRKWEYKTVQLLDAPDYATNLGPAYADQLNEEGQIGWELVTIVRTDSGSLEIAFLKREIP